MAWTTPITQATGTLITAAIWNQQITDNLIYLKAKKLAYTEFTAPVSVAVTTAATATTVVTASAVTFDGATEVEVEFFAPRADTPNVLSCAHIFELYDGATDLGSLGSVLTPAAVPTGVPVRVSRVLTPSAAAHTYSVRAWINAAGTGTVQAGVGGIGTLVPGFIRITKV
jgi:hypothetical protein